MYDWVSPTRKAMLQGKMERSDASVLAGFPPGTAYQPWSFSGYKLSYLWAPENARGLASTNFDACYHALSLPSGPGDNAGSIVLGTRNFDVSRDLEAALRSLRETPEFEHDILLWVDGICTNQLDEEEKMAESYRKRDIYRGA